MTFEAILGQIIDLLERQGRVSYGAIKRRFDLDDTYLEDIKIELVDAQRLAKDEEGRVLVWAPSAEAYTPNAERRQLTVMFCDLVGSTELSSQLDPEMFRELLRAYQEVCVDVIRRFEGYVARYMGDGLLVYFGYPQAHENAAQRSVHTGLGIIDALPRLNAELHRTMPNLPPQALEVRIGIHTGMVVIEEIGAGLSREHQALGETPNLAARLEGIAPPNTVVISEDTYRLVQGYFVCGEMALQTLKGFAEPIQVYHVHRRTHVESLLEAVAKHRLTPLVGRDAEVTLLLDRWAQAKRGMGQAVLLSGEAGLGKSRLVQVMKNHVAHEDHILLECRSSPYYRYTTLHPFIGFIHHCLQWQHDTTHEEQLATLEHALSLSRLPLKESISLLAPILSFSLPSDRYPPLNLPPQRQRQKTFELLVAMVSELTEQKPVFFILEDLHWADPSTLELLDLLIDQIPPLALLTMLTCRPDFQPTWTSRAHLTSVTLSGLPCNQIKTIAEQVTGGKTLPAEILQQLVEKTDGVPLFVEEMTKAILELDVLHEAHGHYELRGLPAETVIPNSLQDSLMARLDRIGTAKGVIQIAATIGRQFSYELLRAVSQLDEKLLQRELTQLVEADLLSQRQLPSEVRYTFKHALIQDAACQSLLRRTRRHYHQRIARVLTEQFPEVAETQPELLAHHLSEAGASAEAIPYWYRAAQLATKRSAHLETIGHLNRGLALTAALLDTPARMQHELKLQLALGNVLVKLKGYGTPEVGQAYARARTLCQQLEDPGQIARVLYGLWVFYLTRAELQTARELAQQILDLPPSKHDSNRRLQGHNAMGSTLCFLGEFTCAYDHLKQSIACDTPQTLGSPWRTDATVPQVSNFAYASWVLWYLGYPDQALAQSHAAQTLADERKNPFGSAVALFYASILHQLRREAESAYEKAEAVIALATELEFAVWVAGGMLVRGWALVAQGQCEEGLAQIQEGMTAWGMTATELIRPSGLAKLAEAYTVSGQPEMGLGVVAEAFASVAHTGMRHYEAELYRLQGQLFLMPGTRQNADAAEASLLRALDIARRQGAKSLELRAAVSLSRLWREQGKSTEARECLSEVYGWFTEGFDTPDLQEAKAWLISLQEAVSPEPRLY